MQEEVTETKQAEVNVPEKPLPNVEDQKDKDFLDEYQRICQKHSRSISVEPKWKLRDDGTYSMTLLISVKRTNK